MKTILVIEDNEFDQYLYGQWLGKYGKVLHATTLQEARDIFSDFPEIDIIVMDGCLENYDYADSVPLIKEMKKTFTGVMIAASNVSEYRIQMVKAGCTHEAEKLHVPALIKSLLAA